MLGYAFGCVSMINKTSVRLMHGINTLEVCSLIPQRVHSTVTLPVNAHHDEQLECSALNAD